MRSSMMDNAIEDTPSTSVGYTDTDIIDICFLNGGTRFATLSPEGASGLTMWTPSEDVPFRPEGNLGFSNVDPSSLLALPGDQIAVGLCDGSIVIADASSSEIPIVYRAKNLHKTEVRAMCSLVPEKCKIVSGSADGALVVSDIESQKSGHMFASDSGATALCAVSGGTSVCAGHLAGRMTLWDLREKTQGSQTQKPSSTIFLETIKDSVTSLAPHPSQANVFAVGTENGNIGIVDVRSSSRALVVNTFPKSSEAPITKLAFHPSLAENLFVASYDGSLAHLDASRAHTYSFGVQSQSGTRQASWCMASLSNSLAVSQLYYQTLGIYPVSFDVSGNSMVVAFDNQMIHWLDGIKLS